MDLTLDDLQVLPECIERMILRQVYDSEMERRLQERREHSDRFYLLHFELMMSDNPLIKAQNDGYYRGDSLVFRRLNKAIYVDRTIELDAYDITLEYYPIESD